MSTSFPLNRDFKSLKVEMDIIAKIPFSDKDYIQFMHENNGGFAFDYSLHIYAASHLPEFHNILYINQFIKSNYGDLVNGLFFFAQDIFSNQFAFSDNGIVFFNIETAEIEIVANNFASWIDVMLDETDFYTGRKLLLEWIENHEVLNENFGLGAKYLFVAGGNYEISNLYASERERIISFNSNFAKQIKDLPDGTPIQFSIEDE